MIVTSHFFVDNPTVYTATAINPSNYGGTSLDFGLSVNAQQGRAMMMVVKKASVVDVVVVVVVVVMVAAIVTVDTK